MWIKNFNMIANLALSLFFITVMMAKYMRLEVRPAVIAASPVDFHA